MTHEITRKFAKQEDGAITALGLFMTISSIVIGGLAIDVAHAMMVRTQLQVAGDVAAHAALYTREWETADVAKQAALDVANVNLPSAKYGSLLTAQDIKFGYWDPVDQDFQLDANSDDGVFVDISRLAAKNNSVGTYFLKFAGIGSWDVRTGSVFETYIPTCFREGFVADDLVDMQSNNTFTAGFCIHSNSHVEMNNDNVFEDNTVVSMPDKNDVITPGGDLSSSPGLAPALRDGAYQLRILNDLPDIIADLYSGGAKYAPDYIHTSAVNTVSLKNVKPSNLSKNQINKVSCVGAQKLRMLANNVFRDVVIVTNCRVELGALVTLDNVIIATSNPGSDSIHSAAELQIGRNDNCTPNGGSQLLSLGSMTFPALLDIYGSQLIAKGDISFTANALGIQGVSMIAGGVISGTSNMIMGFCNNAGMERNFEVEYFRLAT